MLNNLTLETVFGKHVYKVYKGLFGAVRVVRVVEVVVAERGGGWGVSDGVEKGRWMEPQSLQGVSPTFT